MLGGTRTVKCCNQCNRVKGRMTPPEWAEFMKRHPTYWRDYDQACDLWFSRLLRLETLSNNRPVDSADSIEAAE
jgi:hypothetical protein